MEIESENTAAKACLFCRIVNGEVEAKIVYSDDLVSVFLDYRPLFLGHCLVVPQEHIEVLTDLPETMIGPFFSRLQLIAQAVENAMNAEGTFVAMNNRVSQSVPHLHVHVVPRRRKDGLKGFFWPRTKYQSDEEMEEVRTAIKDAVDKSGTSR